MASPVIRKLLVEKYRPTTLDTYVFQNKETESLIRKWVKDGEWPNVLLSGTAGTGKSTISRILIGLDGINQGDVKRINGSITNGIDFIRNELEPWLTRAPLGKFKVVEISEADRLTPNAQDALREVTEAFSDDVRFIMTCNHPKRLSEALLSRFESGHIQMSEINKDGIIDLCLDIIEAEGINVVDADDFMGHIDTYAPDIRRVINSIDKHTVDGVLQPLSHVSNSVGIDSWINAWDAEELEWHKLLELTDGIDATNYDEYFTIMYNNHRHFPDIASGLIHLAEYLYRCSFVANHRLLLDACLYHIFEVGSE